MCLAVPGQVVSLASNGDETLRTATVNFAGVRKDVCLAFTPEAKPGDYVLVHVGFSLCVIDEAEAHRVFELLKEMGELE